MLEVQTSGEFIEEKKYIIDVLISEFLGLPCSIKIAEQEKNFLLKTREKKLIVEDHFFNNLGETNYLKQKFLPRSVQAMDDPSWNVDRLPVIFGHPEIQVDNNVLTCKADLFASAFFMLTRWEEYVKPDRDQYERFPAYASLAYQQGFHQRAVVNEYAALLFILLQYLDPLLEKKKRTFTLTPTHDIDDFRRWGSLVSTRKSLAHNFITQKKIGLGLKNVKSLIKTILKLEPDPYLTFDYLDKIAKENGLNSHFYFMAGGKTKYDNRYSIANPEIIEQIIALHKAGHTIGLHPSFNSYRDTNLLTEEKEKLESLTGVNITSGRQHYLRFSLPHTWQLWEELGMKIDSTLGYSEVPGFRCGTCFSYPAFNILTRKTLQLREMPLILMERSLTDYMALSPEQAMAETEKIFGEVKKHEGNFVFLWHNSTMFSEEFKRYRFIFEQIFKGFHARK